MVGFHWYVGRVLYVICREFFFFWCEWIQINLYAVSPKAKEIAEAVCIYATYVKPSLLVSAT